MASFVWLSALALVGKSTRIGSAASTDPVEGKKFIICVLILLGNTHRQTLTRVSDITTRLDINRILVSATRCALWQGLDAGG